MYSHKQIYGSEHNIISVRIQQSYKLFITTNPIRTNDNTHSNLQNVDNIPIPASFSSVREISVSRQW